LVGADLAILDIRPVSFPEFVPGMVSHAVAIASGPGSPPTALTCATWSRWPAPARPPPVVSGEPADLGQSKTVAVERHDGVELAGLAGDADVHAARADRRSAVDITERRHCDAPCSIS
jgi:hypothetical protein